MFHKKFTTFCFCCLYFNIHFTQDLYEPTKKLPELNGNLTAIEHFERAYPRPMNFEFYVNFGHLFLTNQLRKNFRTFFEVPLGVSLGYERFTLNFQYNLVFGNVRDPFEYDAVLFEEKTSYGLMNLSAAAGYRFFITPLLSVAPKVGIISSNIKGMNDEFDENPISYPTLKSNAPVFILNIDFDTMYENDRHQTFDDIFEMNRRKYAMFSRLQFLYSTPNFHRLSEDIGKGSMFMVSLGFGIHRHFMR